VPAERIHALQGVDGRTVTSQFGVEVAMAALGLAITRGIVEAHHGLTVRPTDRLIN